MAATARSRRVSVLGRSAEARRGARFVFGGVGGTGLRGGERDFTSACFTRERWGPRGRRELMSEASKPRVGLRTLAVFCRMSSSCCSGTAGGLPFDDVRDENCHLLTSKMLYGTLCAVCATPVARCMPRLRSVAPLYLANSVCDCVSYRGGIGRSGAASLVRMRGRTLLGQPSIRLLGVGLLLPEQPERSDAEGFGIFAQRSAPAIAGQRSAPAGLLAHANEALAPLLPVLWLVQLGRTRDACGPRQVECSRAAAIG